MKGRLLRVNQTFVTFYPMSQFWDIPNVITPSFHRLAQNNVMLVKDDIVKNGGQRYFVVYCKLGVGKVNVDNSYEVIA
jgi:hypothetical protein